MEANDAFPIFFTPFTTLMENIIQQLIEYTQQFDNVSVNYYTYGEGEHKIINEIKKLNEQNILL